MDYSKIFNPLAFKETKKDEFRKSYEGKLDVDEAWRWIQKALPKKKKSEPRKEDS